MHSQTVVLIPARFNSSRFPGKPLATIDGKTMIERVYENALTSGFETFVVTDDQRIDEAVKKFGGQVLRVDDEVETGSERIILAYERFLKHENVKFVINFQGDEPLLKGGELKKLIHYQGESGVDIATMVRKRSSKTDLEAYKNSNVVKVIFEQDSGQCFYFSRAAIPFDRDQKNEFSWFQHVGVYSYSVNALMKFKNLRPSYYENLEKLEQLRALEAGLKFGAIETKLNLIGVDAPEDILKVEGVLRGKK